MIRRIRNGLTYANVVATLALFLALGGVAYAGLRPLLDKRGSVDSRHIDRGAVDRSELAPGAVGFSELGPKLQERLGGANGGVPTGTWTGSLPNRELGITLKSASPGFGELTFAGASGCGEEFDGVLLFEPDGSGGASLSVTFDGTGEGEHSGLAADLDGTYFAGDGTIEGQLEVGDGCLNVRPLTLTKQG